MHTEKQRAAHSRAANRIGSRPRKRRRLNTKQLLAVELRALGRGKKEICDEIGVHPSTFWRWRKTPEFQAELDVRRREIVQADRDRMRSLHTKCLDAIEKAVDEGGPLGVKTALRMVELITKDWGPDRIGETTGAWPLDAQAKEDPKAKLTAELDLMAERKAQGKKDEGSKLEDQS